jgi:hypothetical protein
VLAIVEDEQEAPAGQHHGERLGHAAAAFLADAERRGHRQRDAIGILQRREVDVPDAV